MRGDTQAWPLQQHPILRRQARQPPHWAPLDQVGLGLLPIPSQTAPHHQHTHQASRPPARPLPHLSFKTCQLVLGFASSNSRLLFFLSRLTEVRGVLWEMESRLGGGGW